jgi:hypothetical protein
MQFGDEYNNFNFVCCKFTVHIMCTLQQWAFDTTELNKPTYMFNHREQ